MSGLYQFQKAIYELLKVDTQLTDLVNINDIKPQGDGQKKDYITINRMSTTPYRTHDRKGEEIRYDILIVTDMMQENGTMANKLVYQHIDRLLGDVRIPAINGFFNIVSYSEGYRELGDDGVTYAGLGSFRSLVLDCTDRQPLTI